MANIPTTLNNPGDLKLAGNFQNYSDPIQGQAALYNDLTLKMTGQSKTGINGNSTLYEFSKVYDNPEGAAQYAANLANQLGVSPDTKIGTLLPRIDDFAKAVAQNEGFKGNWAAPTKNFVNPNQTPTQGNNFVTPPNYQIPSTPTPPPAPDKSFGQKANDVVTGFGNAMTNFGEGLLNPFARLGVTGYNAIAAPIAGLAGGPGAFQQQLNKQRNIGFNQPVQPYLGNPSDNRDVMNRGLSAAGGAAQIASYGLGGGGASGLSENLGKQTIGASSYQGAKTGLLTGLFGGGGAGLQNQLPNQPVSQTIANAGIGALAGGVSGGLLGGGLGALGGFVENQPTSAEQDAWQAIQPKGKDVNPASLQAKNTVTGSVVVSVPVSDYDQKMLQAALPYKPSPSDPIGSWQRLTQGIETQADDLRNSLDPEQGVWSTSNIQGVLNKVKVPIGAKGEASASQVQGVQDFVMNLAQDADKHTVGTLDLSRDFRQGINDAYGENVWNKDTAIASYIKAINKALNAFTASKLPQGTLANGMSFADAMQNISLLLGARENIVLPKVGTQISKNLLGKSYGLVAPVIKKAIPYGLGAHLP